MDRYYKLAILVVINLINFLDRLSIASVLSSIIDYFHLSSAQGGLLSTCFLIGYMFSAPVFGYLGDKFPRKWIITCGVVFWSLSAFYASLLGDKQYILFFMSRMLVGVGEASYSTIAPTIIADLFEPKSRKFALAIFYFAIPFGSGLGFLMGTLALKLGDWRWVFRLPPLIGLTAAALLAFIDEPVRGQLDGATTDSESDASLTESFRYLCGIRSFIWSNFGFTACLFATGALSWWCIKLMGVAHGTDYESTATTIFGGIVFVAGFLGVTLGSYTAHKFRPFDARSDPLVCALGVLLAVPNVALSLLFCRSNLTLCWIAMFIAVTFLGTNWVIVSDMVLSTVVPSKRAFATSIQVLMSHLLGDATSPFIVGFIKDELNLALNDEYKSFMYALLTTVVVLALGTFAFATSAKYYTRDIKSYQNLVGQPLPQHASSIATDLPDLTSNP